MSFVPLRPPPPSGARRRAPLILCGAALALLAAGCGSSTPAASTGTLASPAGPSTGSAPATAPRTTAAAPGRDPGGARTTLAPGTAAGSTAPVTTAAAASPAPGSATPRAILHGTGSCRTVWVDRAAAAPGRTVRYAVQIEGGIPVDGATFDAAVHATLTDPRGWQPVDHVAFAEVADPAQAAIIVTLATPPTTDALCAPLDTAGWLDCWNGARAVINSDRWLYGADSYGSALAAYRNEVVNHEVGHGLGHGHLFCPGPGRNAPVMQQQTISLQGCRANPWPTVTGG